MLLEILVGVQNIQCPLITTIDSSIIYEMGDKDVMSCFQILTLQEKYGDDVEEMVPLNQAVITHDELRYLNVLHVGYDGCIHVGELIVNVKVAEEVLEIFKELYNLGYPIEKMHVMSYYHGSDELSMEDNNSSAFNFREVTDGGKLSNHAYGLAIDLNPKVNPYIKNNIILPINGQMYVNRDQSVLGIIKQNDAVHRLFTSYGWIWGGDWSSLKDYQHFEKSYFD